MLHLPQDGWLYTISSVDVVGLVSNPTVEKEQDRKQGIDYNCVTVGDIPLLVPIGLSLLELFPGWISTISEGFKDLYEVQHPALG